MRLAAVDCGSHSTKLVVADVDPAAGVRRELVRELRMTSLGQGVDRTRRLAPDARCRTLAACDAFAATIRRLRVERLRCCATSAVRDARDGAEFALAVQARLGVAVDVLSGEQEAALSYEGVARGLQQLGARWVDPLLVVDIGGGSTELVLGAGTRVLGSASADVGSVRITERHLATDPPTPAEREAAGADVDNALAAVSPLVSEAATLVGVSGTAVTVGALALGLDTLDSDRLHGARVDAGAARRSCRRLLTSPVAARLELGVMHPGRADVIGGGAVVLDRVLAASGVEELLLSTHELVDGMIWSLLDRT